MNKVFSFYVRVIFQLTLRYLKSKYNPTNKCNSSFKHNVYTCLFAFWNLNIILQINSIPVSNIMYARVYLSAFSKMSVCLSGICVFVCVHFFIFVINLSVYSSKSVCFTRLNLPVFYLQSVSLFVFNLSALFV